MTRTSASGGRPAAPPYRLSDELAAWARMEGDRSLGGLFALFGRRAFALSFVLLLGVPALPLPTGGATHVLELVAVLVAAQLVTGRDEIRLPRRWGELRLDADGRFLNGLIRLIRALERVSRPRWPGLFRRRAASVAFGLLAAEGAVAAFLAPPFTGLDTLPALGVVLLALAVLLEDAALAALGILVQALGNVLVVLAGVAAISLL